MKRRAFVTLFGGAAVAWPLAAIAQSAGKIPKVGFVTHESLSVQSANLQALRQGLRELGYIEGKNILIEPRSAEGSIERAGELGAQLVRLGANIIVVAGSAATRVVRNSTKDVPIVMAYAGDPVGAGFADSLARPGGRITGLASLSAALGAKRLEILKDTLPGIASVAVLWDPNLPENRTQFNGVQSAAKAMKLQLRSLEVRRAEEIDAVFQTASGTPAGALLVLEGHVIVNQLAKILQFAQTQRLPTIFQRRDHVEAGGLMSYGPNFPDMFRRAASYVDRILKGAKPAELPIEQPTRFDIAVNLRTAKALGLTIPASVRMRVDEMIQ